MKRPLLLFLLALLLFLSGFDAKGEAAPLEEPPTRSAVSSPGAGAGSSDAMAPADTQRFEIDLNVRGPLTPGQPLDIRLEVRNNLSAVETEVKLLLPEVALAKKARQRHGDSRTIAVPIGEPLPTEMSLERRIGGGQSMVRTADVRIMERGYYRVLATAQALPGSAALADGRQIDNAAGETLWLWIDEDGGRVTERFDRSLFPENARRQPGPLTLRSEPWRFHPAGRAAAAGDSSGDESATPSSSPNNSIDLTVTYVPESSTVPKPLEDARVEVTIYEGQSGNPVAGSTQFTDAQGQTTIGCPGYGNYSEVKVYANNADVNVYDAGGGTITGTTVQAEECGQAMALSADSKISTVYAEMNEIIDESRAFFQASRGEMNVLVSYEADGSFYDGGDDEITIEEEDAEGFRSDNWTIAHEYGHAFHLKGLNGNLAGDECPDAHYLEGAHNIECAFSEGFADYHAFVTFGNRSVSNDIEDNPYYPADPGVSTTPLYDNGSIIEGAVAAFLYDLTDEANEPHDDANYPGRYVADVMETCFVQSTYYSGAANGIDHLIACLQLEKPNYAEYFLTRIAAPSFFSEDAQEPPGWSRFDVKQLWRKNLYGEDYALPSAITADYTVESGGTRVIDGTSVGNGATLTLEPGATLKFRPNKRLIIEDGAGILAEGTSSDKIRFKRNNASEPWDGVRGAGAGPAPRLRARRLPGDRGAEKLPGRLTAAFFRYNSEGKMAM